MTLGIVWLRLERRAGSPLGLRRGPWVVLG